MSIGPSGESDRDAAVLWRPTGKATTCAEPQQILNWAPMRGLSAIFAAVLFAQSLGLSAPCMCDVDAQSAVETAAASDHSCCHGGTESDAASPTAASDSDVAGTIARNCGDACQCDASLTPAVLPEFTVGQVNDDASKISTFVTSAQQLQSVGAQVASSHVRRWTPPPCESAPARRLSRLQVWRC